MESNRLAGAGGGCEDCVRISLSDDAGGQQRAPREEQLFHPQRTGKKIPIQEKNGTFEISVWVPKATKAQKRDRVVDQIRTSNRYKALQEDEEEDEDQKPGFSRQDAEF